MTSLAAWIAIDTHGPSAIHVVTDSLITYGRSDLKTFQKKVFVPKGSTEIFAVSGDYDFPSNVLPGICSLIEKRAYFNEGASFHDKVCVLENEINERYPSWPKKSGYPLEILFLSKEGERMEAKFKAVLFRKEPTAELKPYYFDLETYEDSACFVELGSGFSSADWAPAVRAEWVKQMGKGLSRTIYSSFCDALTRKLDARSGGAPQLASIYRKGSAKNLGVIFQDSLYLEGVQVEAENISADTECRNEIFEECSCQTKIRFKGSQRHEKLKK